MGPLSNLRIVEFAGIGPGPFCAMLFADLGAKVIRIDRKEASGLGVPKPARYDLLLRGRKVLALDLKREAGIALARRLVDESDALIEGFRPGVMERLGPGPDLLLSRNPRLVYGRMTGWGQDSPLARSAGHDLNYIALGEHFTPLGAQAPLRRRRLISSATTRARYISPSALFRRSSTHARPGKVRWLMQPYLKRPPT